MSTATDDYESLITGNAIVTFCVFILTLFTAGRKIIKMLRPKQKTEQDEELAEIVDILTHMQDSPRRRNRHRRVKETHRNVKNICKHLEITAYSNSDS